MPLFESVGCWGCRAVPESTQHSVLTPHSLSQNAFWFCLGWCTFFLIPSIVFAVKTSKYFRPIRKRLR